MLYKIKEHEKNLLDTPANYDLNHHLNVITKFDIEFQKECAGLEHAGISCPHELTVFEFEAKRAYFDKPERNK